MADISTVVSVTVNKAAAAVDRAGFSRGLGVFQVPTSVQSNRVAVYSTVQEMIDAGFDTNDNAVEWARIVKQQTQPGAPASFAIGRRVPGTAQVDTVTITTADAGTWSITINGETFSYIAGASDTDQTIATGLRARLLLSSQAVDAGPISGSGPYTFTVSASVAGEAFTNGGIVVPGAGAGTFANTTPNAAAEAMATTLAAISTENVRDWVYATIETRNDADITAFQSWIGGLTPGKIGIAQSNDPDARDGVASNIFDTMQALNPADFFMLWHDDDREYLDGGALGILSAAKLDEADGALTMFGKQIVGVPVDVLTSAQVLAIAGDGESNAGFGGNVHIEVGGRGFLMYGRSAEGEFIDVEQTILWTEARVSEAWFAVLATTPTKVPYINAGIARARTVTQGVLDDGVTNGHFSPDTPPTVSVPDSGDVSTADKTNRFLRNVIGRADLAGAIHKTSITINVGV